MRDDTVSGRKYQDGRLLVWGAVRPDGYNADLSAKKRALKWPDKGTKPTAAQVASLKEFQDSYRQYRFEVEFDFTPPSMFPAFAEYATASGYAVAVAKPIREMLAAGLQNSEIDAKLRDMPWDLQVPTGERSAKEETLASVQAKLDKLLALQAKLQAKVANK
ncbi:MAG: hypothetical protein WC822_06705 [Candidatus Paceibacterota bacterium]